MIFKPVQLGQKALGEDELVEDKKKCRRYGPCGVGEKAVYLNSFYFDRRYYVVFSSIKRMFKRIAMSKGGFTGKGVFASIPYLVVEYDDGKYKQCNFKREEDVDLLLEQVRKTHSDIPLHSEEAERRLAEKQRMLEARKAKEITAQAAQSIQELEKCRAYLEERQEQAIELSAAAKRKRAYDRSNPAYKWVALAIVLMGVAAAVYGVYALMTHAGFALYFLLFGLAAVFLFSGANVLPTSRNNKRAIEERLRNAVKAQQTYIDKYPGFPLPAYYAHPIVLQRMIRTIEEGRAQTAQEALETVKKDLQALNSSVQVEQEEYDEVVAVKPMFLVAEYR